MKDLCESLSERWVKCNNNINSQDRRHQVNLTQKEGEKGIIKKSSHKFRPRLTITCFCTQRLGDLLRIVTGLENTSVCLFLARQTTLDALSWSRVCLVMALFRRPVTSDLNHDGRFFSMRMDRCLPESTIYLYQREQQNWQTQWYGQCENAVFVRWHGQRCHLPLCKLAMLQYVYIKWHIFWPGSSILVQWF